MLFALKFGNSDLKNMLTALELLPAVLGLRGLLYKLIESGGGRGSKLSTGVITFCGNKKNESIV